MARITVEDCLAGADNRFALALTATKRARQLPNGADALVEGTHGKPTVLPLRAIAGRQGSQGLIERGDRVTRDTPGRAGQTRKSGEPYITHPVAVATILAELGMDAETIIAAILHDTLEDTPLPRAEIEATFGPTVAELVDGVTKLDKVKFRSLQDAAAE